jgi:hypothetical protein
MAAKKFLTDYTKFFATNLVSAGVVNAAPSNVVLTFAPAISVKRFKKATAAMFTLAGKTIDTLTLNYTAGTVTVHVTAPYVAGAGFNITFNPTYKGDTVVQACTNTVA